MKTTKIFGKSDKASNSYSRVWFPASCKWQFSCNFHGFNSLEIYNIDVCLKHLSKYIFATNNTTVYMTASDNETKDIEILGIFFTIFNVFTP